jgi:hypothetical protein
VSVVLKGRYRCFGSYDPAVYVPPGNFGPLFMMSPGKFQVLFMSPAVTVHLYVIFIYLEG